MTEQEDKDQAIRSWEQEQLERAKVPDNIRQAVTNLLDAYWESIASQKFTRAEGEKTLTILAELVQGHALVPDEPEAVWIQAKPGALVIREHVRVRADAYPEEVGLVHNLREGVITGIRNGMIFVKYTDGKEPSFEFTKHYPAKLEKRIQ